MRFFGKIIASIFILLFAWIIAAFIIAKPGVSILAYLIIIGAVIAIIFMFMKTKKEKKNGK